MMRKQWFNLLRENLGTVTLVTVAFAVPMILANYMARVFSLGESAASMISTFVAAGAGLLFLGVPFAVCRSISGSTPLQAIRETLRQFGQVLQYVLLLAVPAIVAYVVVFGLSVLLIGTETQSSVQWSAAAVTLATTVVVALYRYRLIAVPPMLALEKKDRKTAAKDSGRISTVPGVFMLFVVVDAGPLLLASMLTFVIPASVGFWIRMVVMTIAGALSAVLSMTVWSMEEDRDSEGHPAEASPDY
jgi:hypothetical protein